MGYQRRVHGGMAEDGRRFANLALFERRQVDQGMNNSLRRLREFFFAAPSFARIVALSPLAAPGSAARGAEGCSPARPVKSGHSTEGFLLLTVRLSAAAIGSNSRCPA